MHHRVWTALLMSGGLAVVLTAGACNRDNTRTTTDMATPGAAGTSGMNAAVSLSGCLQKGSGMNDYILTQASSTSDTYGTSGSVGTSGAATTGSPATRGSADDAVRQDQRAAAMRSYRLSGDKGQLKDLVGTQVRISGRITDQGNVTPRSDRSTTDIDSGDLAKVDVDSVTKMNDACSTNNSSR